MLTLATLLIATAPKEPVTISIGSWLVAERTPTKWTQPRKKLNGISVNLKNMVVDAGPATLTGKIVIPNEEDTHESDRVETNPEPEANALYVSGGKATALSAKHLSTTDPAFLKIASEYAARKGSKAKKIVIHDVTEADLNGDGQKDIVLSFASAYDGDRPGKGYFSAVIVRSQVKGKMQTSQLLWETHVGQMRGPWKSFFVGAGDFDGDKKTEFVVKTQDSWLQISRLVQLGKSGVAKTLCTTYFGD